MKWVKPQARMKAANSTNSRENGKSWRRRTKYNSTNGMERYANQMNRSEPTCSHISPVVHSPQSFRGTKPDVSINQSKMAFIGHARR